MGLSGAGWGLTILKITGLQLVTRLHHLRPQRAKQRGTLTAITVALTRARGVQTRQSTEFTEAQKMPRTDASLASHMRCMSAARVPKQLHKQACITSTAGLCGLER